jgi:hypothetical protein
MPLKARFGPSGEGGIGPGRNQKPARPRYDAAHVRVDRRTHQSHRGVRAVTEEPGVIAAFLGARDDRREREREQGVPGYVAKRGHRPMLARGVSFVEAQPPRRTVLRAPMDARHWEVHARETIIMHSQHSPVREGLVAGAIGATGVAVWFLVLDMVAGQPLFTPSALGAVLAGDFSSGSSDVHLPWVIGYTVFHFVAFLALGLLLSFVAHRAEQEPSILAVFLLLFVVFELGFYGLTAILAETRLPGALAWYRVAGGNLVAAVLMGSYLWKGHRALPGELANALGARE